MTTADPCPPFGSRYGRGCTSSMTDTVSAPSSIAVLTSGGDAGGMNAAVRAVVRTALFRGVDAYVIYNGYQGLVDGGEAIRRASSADVGGILHRGGTVFGTARCAEFRTKEGRRKAVGNLLERRIDALVVIGGDGSLAGANEFREEWADTVAELVAAGQVTAEVAASHPFLRLVGLAGSIDNDMSGTDMTIGADTALHRITEALDSIRSTASSHQRTFVVEVMGRRCGYLAMTAGLATAANWLLIPERPPEREDWAQKMCAAMRAGHEIGRRQSLVLVTEGAQSRDGEPITVERVKEVLEEQLGEDARVTILGHVQRGGAPSAFDRCLATLLGNAAVEQLLAEAPDATPQLIGIRGNQVASSPLMECLARTREVADRIAQQDYDGAMLLRGGSFSESEVILSTMQQAAPRPTAPGRRRFRLAVLHGKPEPSAPGCGGSRRGLLHGAQDDLRLGEAAATQQHRAVVVLLCDAVGDLAGPRQTFHQGRAGHLVAPNSDQLRCSIRRFGEQLFDSRVSQQGGQAPVESARCASALDVAQDGDAGIFAELLLQHLFDAFHRDRLAIAALGAFSDQHQALPTADLVSCPHRRTHLLRPVLALWWALGNQQPVRCRRQPGRHRQIAAASAHHLDDERALMARCGAADRVQRLRDPVS